MVFTPQAAPKTQNRSGGRPRQEFDPRPTPKEFMMARMSAGQVGSAMAAVELEHNLLPEGTDFYQRAKALMSELYAEIVAAGNDSPRAGDKPAQSQSKPAQEAPAAQPTGVTTVPDEVKALPHSEVIPPIGKYGPKKGNLTLAEIFVQPAERSVGACWLIWFAGTDQSTAANIEFKNQVVEFLNAAEAQGMLPASGVCDG